MKDPPKNDAAADKPIKGETDIGPETIAFLNKLDHEPLKRIPVPESLLRMRQIGEEIEAEKKVHEQPFSDSVPPAEPEGKQGPERFIGPSNPKHPKIKPDGGGRGPS